MLELAVLYLAACQMLLSGGGVQAAGANLMLSFEEEQPVGSVVANVVEEAHLDAQFPPDVLTKLRFRFLSKPDTSFMIEDATGVIRTSGRVDRENICPRRAHCRVELNVAIHPVQYLEIIKVNVEIVDINDNFPEFPTSVISHQILESAANNTNLVIPSAQDPDSPELGVQNYRLVSSSDKFKLDVRRKRDGNLDVRLVLVGRLDREVKDLYKVKIIAYDGGEPERSGTVDVTIVVLDANDNDPHFELSTYEVSIQENIALHKTIAKVHASDPDLGLNGEVVYSLFGQTKDDFGHLFGINNMSGEIYVKGIIDYEETDIYHLGVVARDRGPDSLPADTTVIVRVADVNDHAPEITVNTLTQAGTTLAEIAEDAVWNTFVAHMTVRDLDKGRNGQFNCTLNDKMFQLKDINPGDYKILTASMLDREERSQYSLAIQCTDGGRKPQTAVTHLKVVVTDVNDHTPMFEQLTYTSKLLENNFEGVFITDVNATDLDIGKNAEIRYSIPREYAHLFNVNPITGRITAAQSLDHEKLPYISFPVIARDNGSPPRSAEASVHVTVENVNDDEPKFSQSHYVFRVFEGQPLGSIIGSVSANDADNPPHNTFSYELLPGGNMADLFAVEPMTGNIVNQHLLDRETQDEYHLILIAQDEGGLRGTANVAIHVEDQNDNAPRFTFPVVHNNTVYLSNKVPVGGVIATVRATDPDIDENGQIRFDVSAGNGERFFQLNSDTGELSVREPLIKVDYESFAMEVTASDLGKPQRSQQRSLFVVVNSSIPYLYESHSGVGGWLRDNYLLVTVAACTLGIVIVILAIIIAIVCRHMMAKHELGQSYNCRTEALKALAKKREEELQGHNPDDDAANEKSKLKLDLEAGGGTWNSLDRKPAHQPPDKSDGQPPPSKDQPSQGNGGNQYTSGQRTPHPRALHTTRWPWKVTNSTCEEEVDMEMQQLLHVLRQEPGDGTGSNCSLEGSTNTDSGHGASDEYDTRPLSDPSRSRSPGQHVLGAQPRQVGKTSTFPRSGQAPPAPSCVGTLTNEHVATLCNGQAGGKSQNPKSWTHKNGYIALPQNAPKSGSNSSLSSDNSSGQGAPTGAAYIYKNMPGVKMADLANRAQQEFTGYQDDMVVDTETGCPGAGEIQYTAANMNNDGAAAASRAAARNHSNHAPTTTVDASKLCDHIDNLFFKEQHPNGIALKEVAV